MSASPLPALTTGSPTTAIHSHAAPSPSTDQARLRNPDSAFNTRLQDERRRQSGASPAAPRTSAKSGANDSSDTTSSKNSGPSSTTAVAATSAANAVASTANTSTVSDVNTPSATDNSAPSSADDTATASLATTVLGLIDQSSGNADEAAAGAPNGIVTKGKTPLQGDNGNAPVQPQPSVMPNAGTVIPVPALVGRAAEQSDGGAATSGVVPATMAASNTPLAQIAGKSGGAISATNDTDASDAADTDPASAGVDGGTGAGSLLGQIAGDAAQASSGALPGAGHATLSVVAASTETDSQSQSGGDLAAMNGSLSAPMFATAPIGILSPHSLSINAPVNSPTFSQQLGQQVAWLGNQDIKQAQIRLNPQELGPLDVKVSIEHGKVDVAFMAQHPATVAAVQQSLSQLNQMLGGHGLSLGQATVGQQASQHQFTGSQSQSSSSGSTVADEEPADGSASTSAQPRAIGLVDAFA
ncbi:flagellar hook-length control protein FliK [Rhodanobacter sp. MP7CTX1]|uniref:flagellar hook-length control protein FliK n=1 Tax=Rhodanobacter sp. MP7CTX1 TaxID=2723084 RepID=UPI0016076E76|nr:flagellar hook-length control protein FliK [Rhodanobacter sp. MP7CTX1]MBB6186246.1 flagellar hook-length control protein FliK [Rhodanobacter sp. MP7CTX1]